MQAGEPCDACPSCARVSAQGHPDSAWYVAGLQCAYSNIQPPPKSQRRFQLRGWKCLGHALGRHRRENIFFLSGIIFSPSHFPFCPSFAISLLSKFTGALPQGEMKAPGCIWWCRRGGDDEGQGGLSREGAVQQGGLI